jgi:predicted nucleic acid-binding protein
MAIAKLKALGFETRYDEPIEEAGESVKARYLDASALVKLYVDEPYSDGVRAFMNAHPKPFNTTSLCFAEAFTVFKRKWLDKDLTTEAYLNATSRLRIAAWRKEIQVHDFGLMDPSIQAEVDEIVASHHIDVSDALQLLTILKERHSGLVHQSASVLVTADKGLSAAAVAKGVKVWNCAVEPAPSWA